MRKVYNLLFILFIPSLFLLFTSEVLYHTGSPGGRTGSPGDGFANCTGCHQGNAAVPEEYWISAPDMLITGYETGQTYDVIVIGISSEANKFGFEATAEDDQGNKVGSFTPNPDGRTQAINNTHAITHTALGNVPLADTGTVWFFKWTAPETNVGNVTFYTAVNTANGNGSNTGDIIHLSNFMVSPSTTGAEEHLSNMPFQIFPNPASDYILVKRGANDAESLLLINTIGQVVKKERITTEQIRIDLTDLEKGIYFLRLGAYSQRLLIH